MLKTSPKAAMKTKTKRMLTFVDLFSGIGGFHLGITQAAKKVGIKSKCILAVDIDSKARLTYSGNFKNTKILNDIKDPFVRDSIPNDIDLICAGFPCQPFSVVGKKKGVDDHRGTLFQYIVQIVRQKKPKAVLLENVRNLLNIPNGNNGSLIDFIKEQMESAGYPISIRTYKASQFGLPTRRDRVYMVGFREDVRPSELDDSWWPKPTQEEPVTLSKFFQNLNKEWDSHEIDRLGWPDRIGRTIRLGGIGSSYKSNDWLDKHNLPADSFIRLDENKVWVNDKRTWDSYLFFEENQKRRKPHTLTVDEARAMMGFPVDFKFPDELSFHQKMRQVGNSVAIPVIKAIAAEIIKTVYK
jgi:DNA (cytosine-5)-methyltransferase 1